MSTNTEVKIPNRFESLQEVFGQEIRPLIVPIETDLQVLNALRDRAKVQNGGIMCFLLGRSGIGKTTAVHSATVHMPDDFAPVLKVPPEVRFRDVVGWLSNQIPAPIGNKALPILFDGRELSDDDVGIRQLISTLNQLLRKRSDVLFCWPTTDAGWHAQLRQVSETVGGANLAPKESDIQIVGPASGEWPAILERLLLQFGKTFEDVGIARDMIGRFCAEAQTIGDFLTKVGLVIADRITKTRIAKKLPQIVFVITSSADVVGEANRIRRAGTQALAPEPLLGYSPRSEAGKWWTERNRNPDHHLGYIISLFDARLVTMTASAVVYACMHSADASLESVPTAEGARPDKGNAKRTIESSEFYRFLKGEQIPEFTTGKKGGILESTAKAYAAVQALSVKRHKAINKALCDLTRVHLPEMQYSDDAFEVAHGGNVITDAMISYGSRPFSLEFHHLSEAQCGAAGMSSYIMDKLRNYSWHHQIIPR